MHSLLEKALEIRRKIESEDPFFFENSENELRSVPAEEREKILIQLDDVVANNRDLLTAEKFVFKPLHKDTVIPAVINIAAAAVIIILSSVFFISFNIDQNRIIALSESSHAAESRMIKVLKEESEEKLREKENEISEIQSKLARLRSEHSAVQLEADEKISRIEAELKESMIAEIEMEKDRLRAEGLSDNAIEEQVKLVSFNLEKEYRNKIDIQLKEYRDLQSARQAEIDRTISEYEKMISSAKTDVSDLEEKLEMYRGEAEKSREMMSENERKYSDIEKEQAVKKLISDQINAGYSEAGNLIKNKDYNAASLRINSLEEYLSSPAIAYIPFIAERRGMDILLINSLRKLIRRETDVIEGEDREAAEKAEKLTVLGSKLSQGNRYFRNNDISSAGKSYNEAYSMIPELDESVKNTVLIEKDNLRNELTESIRLKSIEREKLEMLDEKEKERIRLRSSLSSFREGILVSDTLNDERRKTLVPLLQTKLKVRRLLTTEDTVNNDPELFAKLEKYIRAYGKERENEGIEKGFKEVNNIIRQIISSDVSVYYDVDENEELEFFFLMDGFEKLIGY